MDSGEDVELATIQRLAKEYEKIVKTILDENKAGAQITISSERTNKAVAERECDLNPYGDLAPSAIVGGDERIFYAVYDRKKGQDVQGYIPEGAVEFTQPSNVPIPLQPALKHLMYRREVVGYDPVTGAEILNHHRPTEDGGDEINGGTSKKKTNRMRKKKTNRMRKKKTNRMRKKKTRKRAKKGKSKKRRTKRYRKK